MRDFDRSTPDWRDTRLAGGLPGEIHARARISYPLTWQVTPDRGCRLLAALGRRMTGPGGYYNVGNLLGLAVGIGVPLAAGQGAGTTLLERFAGDPGAVAMSAATLVFLVSGELYHRAFAGADGPDPSLNRMADLMAGVGSLLLGIGLLMFGHVLLAVAAGGLLALGKFGSAFRPACGATVSGRAASWPDPFRLAVVAGRFPAMLASGANCWTTSLFVLAGGSALSLLTPAAMLVCQLLWLKADLLLLASDGAAEAPVMRPGAEHPPPNRVTRIASRNP